MTDLDEHGRPRPPIQGDEISTLLGFLDYHRATFAWKCSELDAAGLNTTVGASTMTLGGMLKHLAVVEEGWFSELLRGNDLGEPWKDIDVAADPDWDWHSAASDSPEELRRLWSRSVELSRECVAEALAEDGLSQLSRRTRHGWQPSLRWIVLHMIEEYARHNGHADLIRESIDGETGS